MDYELIAKSYICVGWADLAVLQFAHTHPLMGDFLIHRHHRYVVIVVVSECRFM
jgi:hypothetical protein